MTLTTSRPPTDQELRILQEEVESYLKFYEATPEAAKSLVAVGESSPDAKLTVTDLAAYTALARLLLNLDETITKE